MFVWGSGSGNIFFSVYILELQTTSSFPMWHVFLEMEIERSLRVGLYFCSAFCFDYNVSLRRRPSCSSSQFKLRKFSRQIFEFLLHHSRKTRWILKIAGKSRSSGRFFHSPFVPLEQFFERVAWLPRHKLYCLTLPCVCAARVRVWLKAGGREILAKKSLFSDIWQQCISCCFCTQKILLSSFLLFFTFLRRFSSEYSIYVSSQLNQSDREGLVAVKWHKIQGGSNKKYIQWNGRSLSTPSGHTLE